MSLPFFNHIKNEAKKEMRIMIYQHQFSDSDLIQFSQKDLEKAQWIDSKEFVLNENLYDVVKIKIINGQKYHYCFLDKKESKIVKIETQIQNVLVELQFNQAPGILRSAHAIKYNLRSCKTNVYIEIFLYFQQSASQIPNFEWILNSSEYIDEIKIPPQV